jgi:hypothetical protein
LPFAAVEFDWLAELADVAPLMPGTAAVPGTDAATLPWGAAELVWVAAFPCGEEPVGAAPFPGIAAPPDGSGVAAGDAVSVGGCVALGVGVPASAGESADIMPGTDACPPDGCDAEGWGAGA